MAAAPDLFGEGWHILRADGSTTFVPTTAVEIGPGVFSIRPTADMVLRDGDRLVTGRAPSVVSETPAPPYSRIPDKQDLDAAADGAFGGKHVKSPLIGDSSDKAAAKNHRAGYGGMMLDGHTYTAAQFVERIARVGGCLNAGEGGLLVDLLDLYRQRFGRIPEDALPTPVAP